MELPALIGVALQVTTGQLKKGIAIWYMKP